MSTSATQILDGEPESLFPRLEPLLARVTKPIQYVGGELNSRRQGLGRPATCAGA